MAMCENVNDFHQKILKSSDKKSNYDPL